MHRRKSAVNTLAALKSIRRARPDGAPIYVILDNLSAHKGKAIRACATRNKVELVFHPDIRVLGQPDRGPVRAATHLRDRRLGPPGPSGADPSPVPIPALAQR
ncbi:hypothetical protein Acy02nite_88080 [Actinoplanes cyaneus]|uniref:Tc1-like transposase DDE domain-containing protein n=1 Tax=Actinoplanes cyaneus TaxID=52696 RepID=A0A919M9J7_9ACTN|nr:hypothetical protein Acy02nite_88080 [Actinoplanes cyaneus]